MLMAVEIWGWCKEVYGVHTVRTAHIVRNVHTMRTVHILRKVPLFADHIRALTESFVSKLANVGNPLVRQLGRYLR
jgi:hypothetical protein